MPMERHTVQFFDGPESLGADVAQYFADGVSAGDQLLLLARPIHVRAVEEGLAALGLSTATLENERRLTLFDVDSTLRGLMCNGRPDRHAFDRLFAAPVRTLAAQGSVRGYGELVDVLAGHGNIRASQELEDLWNELLAATPIQLHCGYTAATFADGRNARAMRSICHQHTHVCTNRSDLLAEWLLSQHTTN